ncbi:unnamed protein product [Medioppia subpectinata]|uniref:Uncharacterized protein n=1 Tax=Medioppia subpectinata TaxID=1979941 RepID=A0A7R9QE20_9ACAR|nr:unnamed protein product [Medioppia subpectinata]CAG2119188.1 unnamed protein product [Medioppia subpectinata]
MPNSVAMDEESLRQQESTLQQAFIEYQMQQMTRNLCTQIAFAANEFTEVNESIPSQIDSLSRINFNFENQLQQKDNSLEFEKLCTERAKTTWSSHNSGPMAPIPMETSNPWENLNATKMETNTTTSSAISPIEPDSWADFSSFPTIDFSASAMNRSVSNSVTTPPTSLSSSEAQIPTTDFPESTTSDEALLASQVGSSSSADSAGAVNSLEESHFAKNSSDDQENVVTSSTSDSIPNGPNS